MKNALLVRDQIEYALSRRMPGALSPRERPQFERTPCGVATLDSLLHGGLAAGALTEFVGEEGSGRTTVALAYMAAIAAEGNVVAWIDVADALDPETVAANGVDLERLLWVRCSSPGHASAAAALSLHQTAGPPTPTETPSSPARHTGGGSPHPRSEGRDMPDAIRSMLSAHGGLYDKQVRREKRFIGTPGAPNRPLTNRSEDREEQVNSDRLPARRGENLTIVARCAEPQPRRLASHPSAERLPAQQLQPQGPRKGSGGPWKALDQALRATDLLLQSGGFSAIVLDLAGVAPEIALRIPVATWFRFRAACERTRVSLILLTQQPCAQSSAQLVVRLQAGCMEAQGNVMTGIRYKAATERTRSHANDARVVSIRKPPQSERPGEWTSEATWAHAR